MATTTLKEFRDKETGNLNGELLEKQKKLFELRGQAVTEKLEDPSQLRKARKDIARIKTILRERTLEVELKAKAEVDGKRQAEADAKLKAERDALKAERAKSKAARQQKKQQKKTASAK